MNTPNTPLTHAPAPATDGDLAQQARPGHGIPSQDPDLAAQLPLQPEEAQRESNSSLLAGGLVAGMATGAVIGVGVAGPAGVVVGGAVGALVGSLGGAVAGAVGDMELAGRLDATTPDTATASSVMLHIEDSGGSGRPVVLIHGWPLSAEAWGLQVGALRAEGYRVVAYDRRGFGRSGKEALVYDYDTLADDLQRVMDQCRLQDVTLVGFSMGGGEVARYVSRSGESRLRSVVLAAAVTPCLMRGPDNPDGPLTPEQASEKREALLMDRSIFFEAFTNNFFSSNGQLRVSEAQRAEAVALCHQSAPHAALACMEAFSGTDFRADLQRLTVPTLVIHGSADAVVPIEGSGLLTHRAVPHSQLVRVEGAPHGMNVSHSHVFNRELLAFLKG
jgi:non-heme chloroperoxidase